MKYHLWAKSLTWELIEISDPLNNRTNIVKSRPSPSYFKHTLLNTHSSVLKIFVPTPLVGGGDEELYTQVVFLFSQFWPIDIFIVEKCEWYH